MLELNLKSRPFFFDPSNSFLIEFVPELKMKLSFEIISQTANRLNFSSSRENSKPYKSTVTLHPLKLTLETRTIARRGKYKKKARWTPHKACKRHPSLAINNCGIGIRRITNPGVKVTFREKRRQEREQRSVVASGRESEDGRERS